MSFHQAARRWGGELQEPAGTFGSLGLKQVPADGSYYLTRMLDNESCFVTSGCSMHRIQGSLNPKHLTAVGILLYAQASSGDADPRPLL